MKVIPEFETPPDFKLIIAANPVKNNKTAFRVVCYERDGSWRYISSHTGLDWRRLRNAQEKADWYNRIYGKNTWCVVKEIRIEESEIDECED